MIDQSYVLLLRQANGNKARSETPIVAVCLGSATVTVSHCESVCPRSARLFPLPLFPPSLSLPLTLTALDSAGHSCAAAFYLLSSSLNHFLLLLHPSTPSLFFPIQVRPSLVSCITYKCLRAPLRLQVRLEFRQALFYISMTHAHVEILPSPIYHSL